MGRRRTGSLVLKPSGFAARLSTANGRKFIGLDTFDQDEARRRLTGLVCVSTKGEETLETYADRWLKGREAAKVVMVREEWGYWKLHSRDILGPLRLVDVRPLHVRDVLDRLVNAGKAKGTIKHVRAFLNGLFGDAWRAEIIPENPVAKVRLPKLRQVKRERELLADDEFTQFVSCPEVEDEIRMLSLMSRILGGMRQGDLHQLDWTMMDVGPFTTISIPRSKTMAPQKLTIPQELRPHIYVWWEQQGKPGQGPVFPARRGDRKGQAKLPKTSYAARLRKELKRAGLTRPELFARTAGSLPVDFHSFRRSFCTALSEAGVPVQRAARLAGHEDVRTHARYVKGAHEIPPEVVPDLGARNRSTDPQGEGAPQRIRTSGLRLRRPREPHGIADLPEGSGTSDQLPSRLVEALADDPQLLAQVLGKLLKK